jgi:hypothetical protein
MATVKKRRFFVTDVESNRREVMPVNFTGKYTFERKLDEGQYFYRKKYNSKIDFTSTTATEDYQYFNAIEHDPALRCQEIIFEVEVLCGQTWNTEWVGVFSTGQGQWDKNNCRFSVSVDPSDEYNCILDNQSREFNLLDNENTINIQVDIEGDYEFYSCRSATPLTGSDYTDCLDSRPLPAESWKEFYTTTQSLITPPEYDYVRVWIREVVTVSCQGGNPVEPTGDGWILLTDNCGVDDTAIFVRQPQSDWTALNNSEVAYGECPDIEPPAPVFFDVDVVVASTAGIRFDILGPDFTKKSLLSVTLSYWLRVPTTSVSVWAIENDGAGAVTGTSNPTQEEFKVTYSYNGGGDVTFDVVCRETTDCGDVIEHRKVVTIRTSENTTPGENVLLIDGPSVVCPDQTEQEYLIPIEYQSGITNVVWSVDTRYFTISAQTSFSCTVVPTGAVTGTGVFNVITAIAEYNDLSQTTYNLVGFVRSAIYTDPIQGQSEVCDGATGVVYRVPERFGATYTWVASDPVTIVSGQGTNEIIVDFIPGWGADTVTIRVSEDTQCGCDWILISECADDGNPPIWWCFKGSGILYTGYLVKDAIEYILDEIACDGIIGVTSDFFEWNPQGDAPGYVAGENYVTGLPNQVNYLTLVQKSDAKDPNATNPATIGKAKFKDFVQWLKEMFQVYWFIDGTRIRFEHISYFQEILGLDLTLPEYALEMVKSNRYAYNSVERPKYETFRMDEAGNQDFIGDDIYYQTLCVNQDSDTNVLEHNVNGITTDIQFVINSPSDVGNNGFVMLATEQSGATYITIVAEGALSTNDIANAPLSWANLHRDFYPYFRYWKDGYINNIYQVFNSYRNTVIQDPVNIKMCCDLLSFDASEAIKTPLGVAWFGAINGTVDKAEYDTFKETLKLTIGYPY